jgi:hypothetical protein
LVNITCVEKLLNLTPDNIIQRPDSIGKARVPIDLNTITSASSLKNTPGSTYNVFYFSQNIASLRNLQPILLDRNIAHVSSSNGKDSLLESSESDDVCDDERLIGITEEKKNNSSLKVFQEPNSKSDNFSKNLVSNSEKDSADNSSDIPLNEIQSSTAANSLQLLPLPSITCLYTRSVSSISALRNIKSLFIYFFCN